MTHTPTPWNNAQQPDKMIVCDAEGGSIADCAPPGPWMSHKIATANADLIVRAVNSHEALVKALRACREYVESDAEDSFRPAARLISEIDDALAVVSQKDDHA